MSTAVERPPPGPSCGIVLAHERSFNLGRLVVHPATRAIHHPDGRREVLEPRVMQVLVALAQAGGSTLTREDLTELCWGGRVVGEDAICRVISRLRRTARGLGSGCFDIETTVRVGYRLVQSGDGSAGAKVSTEAREEACAYLWLTQSPAADTPRLIAELSDIADVCMIHGLSGSADLLVRLDARSVADIAAGRAAIGALAGVSRVETSIVMARYLG